MPPLSTVLFSHRVNTFKAVLRVFLGLLDPDPLVRGMNPDPSFSKQKQCEKPRFLLFCDLSLKNYVNVPSKSNMQKNSF
jgi:hypothetical protein